MSNKYLEKIAMTAGVSNLISGIRTGSKLEADLLKGKAKNILKNQVNKHIPTGGMGLLGKPVARY